MSKKNSVHHLVIWKSQNFITVHSCQFISHIELLVYADLLNGRSGIYQAIRMSCSVAILTIVLKSQPNNDRQNRLTLPQTLGG